MQLSLDSPLPVVLREKKRSVSQSNIWGKVPECCPGSVVPLLCTEKVEEKGELVTDAGKRPHAEAQARTSPAGKKEGGIKTNKSQEEEVGTEKELLSPRLGPGAIAHPCNESSPSSGSGHVQTLFWETEAGSAPAAQRASASARRSSRGHVLPVSVANPDAAVTARGGRDAHPCRGRSREAEHRPRVAGLCQDKKQPRPQ